jgi:hypothetical protein
VPWELINKRLDNIITLIEKQRSNPATKGMMQLRFGESDLYLTVKESFDK